MKLIRVQFCFELLLHNFYETSFLLMSNENDRKKMENYDYEIVHSKATCEFRYELEPDIDSIRTTHRLIKAKQINDSM